jgi:hypothetical protein
MPGVVLVHRLEIVGAEQQDHQRQRRVDLDALRQAGHAVAAGFERILPDRAPAVETVFDDAHRLSARRERELHHAGPAGFERQAPTRFRNDPPRERVGVDEDLLHGRRGD